MTKMFKNSLVALTLTVSALTMTGCFGPNHEKDITNKIISENSKYEKIDSKSIFNEYVNTKKIEMWQRDIMLFNACTMTKNSEIKEFLTAKSKEMKNLGNKLKNMDNTNPEFKKDFDGLEKHMGTDTYLTEFTRIKNKYATDFKEKDPDLYSMLFSEEVKNATSGKDLVLSFATNGTYTYIMNPLFNKYSKEAFTCLEESFGVKPVKVVDKVTISEDEKTAVASVHFYNGESGTLNFSFDGKTWVQK